MAEIVTMPKLGFDMAEGTLVRWVLAEGDAVYKGSVLAEIETDKATVEVESAYEGVVTRHLVPQGEVVPVNTPIAVVASPGEQVDYQALGLTGAAPAAAVALAEEKTRAASAAAPSASAADESGQLPGGVRASPVARRVAQERGIDLRRVRGSGPHGRIVKADLMAQDIESYRQPPAETSAPIAATPAPAPGQKPASPAPAPIQSAQAVAAAGESIPMNRLRAAIGRRMTEAKQQVPHFYVTHEVDMAPLMSLRKQANNLLEESEKLSVNDFIIRAVALSLRQFPNLNASLEGDTIRRHGQVNIGVAVAVQGGLLTVVCRDADLKSVRQIAQEVRGMAERARLGKVRPEDIEGSTFSISNLGMFDVEHFIAIINPPEAAILAVGSARQVPVVQDGEIRPGWRMKVTISVDHRVSDGAEAAQYLQTLAQYLEQPLRLLV